MKHPHPDKEHVMRCYRAFVIGSKRKWGTFRGFAMRRAYLETYMEAKREWLENRYIPQLQ